MLFTSPWTTTTVVWKKSIKTHYGIFDVYVISFSQFPHHHIQWHCAFTTNVCNCHHKSKTRNRTRKKLRAIYHEKRGKKRKILDGGSAEVPMNKSTTTTRGQRGSYLLLVSKYVQSRKRGFFWCSMASNNVVGCYSTTASAAAVQILGKNEKNWSFPWSSSLVPTWI